MYVRLFSIIAPIVVCAGIGYAWARSGRPFDTDFITRLLMNVGMPFLVVSSLTQTRLDRASLAEAGLAAVCLLAGFLILGAAALGLLRRDLRTYLTSVLFPNMGNMGLPLCLFAFGPEGLSLALVVFLIVSITHFTFGVALVSGRGDLGQVVRSPIIYATVIGVFFVLTGWVLPLWVRNTLDILAGLTIPLMLLTLGVSLANLKIRTLSSSFLLACLRLAFGFAVGLAVAEVLDLSGTIRGVVILEASMPVAVFNYLLAQRYDRSPSEVAGNVVVSTVLSFFTIPLVLWYVLSG